MYNALTDDSTGAVLGYGYSTFKPRTGQTEVALNRTTKPIVETLDYNKVLSGDFVEMTAPEKAAVDAANAAKDEADAEGAINVGRTVRTTADLPVPPPKAGLMVAVDDIGAGTRGLAISDATSWAIFAAARVVP